MPPVEVALSELDSRSVSEDRGNSLIVEVMDNHSDGCAAELGSHPALSRVSTAEGELRLQGLELQKLVASHYQLPERAGDGNSASELSASSGLSTASRAAFIRDSAGGMVAGSTCSVSTLPGLSEVSAACV